MTSHETVFPLDQLWAAQLVGALAFEGAQRLLGRVSRGSESIITERQRDCVLWAARGNTDAEIAEILGISNETVIQHLKFARERYGVRKRTTLVRPAKRGPGAAVGKPLADLALLRDVSAPFRRF